MLFKKISLIFCVFISTQIYSQNLKQGWEHFTNNEYDKSKAVFEKLSLSTDPKVAFEAQVSLTIVSDYLKKPALTLSTFEKLSQSKEENINPYLFALWTDALTSNRSSDLKKSETILLNLNKNTALNGTSKALVNQELKDFYKANNNFSKSELFASQTQSVSTWSIVGTFENISASGFDKDFEPIHHPEKEYTFTEKEGAPVNWFDLKNYKSGDWIDFSSHFDYNNSIIFAQTFCNSPAEQEVYFRLGTSGSTKLWLNDQVIIQEENEWNNDLDTYAAKVKLKKGINRILIQVGESEAGRSNFMLRITDKNAFPISGLTYQTTPAAYDKSKTEVTAIPFIPEVFFQNKIKEEPANMLNYLLLSEVYLHNDKYYESRAILKKLAKESPNCAFLKWQMIDMYNRKDDRTNWSETLESLKKIDKDNPQIKEIFFSEEIEKKDFDKASQYLKEINTTEYGTAKIYSLKIQLASAQNNIEDLYKLIDEGYAKYPENYQFVYLKYLVEKEKKNSSGALKVIDKYLKKNYNPGAITLKANYFFGINNVNAGIDQYKLLVAKNPNAVGYFYELGNIYLQLRDYNTALSYFNKALEIAPYIGVYIGVTGDCYKELGFKDRAIKTYEKALLYNPTDYVRRRKLKELKNEPEIWSYFSETPNYDSIFTHAPDASKFPEDNSIILLNKVQNVIYGDGGAEKKEFLMVKVFNTAGIDTWKEYQIDVNGSQGLNVEKAEVLKKDGSRLKAEENNGYIVFTKLEEGDVILLVYHVKDYSSGILAKQFWDKHYFCHWYPIQNTSYQLLVPKDKKFNYTFSENRFAPQIDIKDGYELYTWEKSNIPAIKYEANMPSLSDVGHVLSISSIPDWNYIAAWYTDLAKNKSKINPEITETTKELFEGRENLSEEEKVRVIYDYIVKNIRYSSVSFRQSGLIPQKASDVINTKMGDCKDVSTLFVSMCKEIGVKAELVLIDTRDNGANNMALPSIDFNHCIAKVNTSDKQFYVELTSDLNGFSSFGSQLKNAFSLDITPNISELAPKHLNPKSRLTNGSYRDTDIKFNGTTMIIEKQNVKTGALAASIRASYRDKGKQEQEKDMLEAISDQYPNIKLTKLDFGTNLNNTSDSVNYQYNYEVRNAFSKVGKMELLKLPWADAQTPLEFLSMEERNYPIEFWKYDDSDVKSETIALEIPKGKKLVEVPADVHLSSTLATYDLTFKLKGNILYIEKALKYKKNFIPVNEYKETKTFFEKMIDADSQQIGFQNL